MNKLITEKSPYLLQHADNPVDWYPWGEEAFDKAKQENKPVFVSIGYSTCHWCHVMAHESFEDKEVAALLNKEFISIKVDREERPDIDSVYMTVCQALTGQGGWPLSVFLTPDQKPFYAGTYFPKESRYGQPGFMDILKAIARQYHENPKKIVESGSAIIETLQKAGRQKGSIHPEVFQKSLEQFKESFDSQFGGFGTAPKFPSPHQLMYLLRVYRMEEDLECLEMVTKTLDGMAKGGIRDHIGGGFARYSVDEKWLVPHFEKMLYDQAMLMMAYTEAYQITKKPIYQEIVEEIVLYIKRELHDSETGGFYSAEDADSEGVEGKYYVWQPAEIYQVLGDDDGERFCGRYDITTGGNFEGASIPNLIGESLDADLFKNMRAKLLEARNTRVHPHKDDKILTSWNGLMIAALALASRIFKRQDYLDLAIESWHFTENTMWQNENLMSRYRGGDIQNKAFLDDYAFLALAADALYEVTSDIGYLTKMKMLLTKLIEKFWDEENYGFFLNDHEANLITRPKDAYDGAIPSGNSVAALVLLKFARRTGQIDLEMYVDKMMNRFGPEVNGYPMGYTFFLTTYLMIQKGTFELVIIDENEKESFHELKQAFLPEVFFLNGSHETLKKITSFVSEFHTNGSETTYYLCEGRQCRQPTIDWASIKEALNIK